MATGWPMKTTYANGDVYSASDVNDITGTINLLGKSVAYTAGKNAIINGAFNVWQRGTSFTNPAPAAYTADRFSIDYSTGTVNCVVSQQSFTAGTAPVSGYESQYFLRISQSAATASKSIYFGQKIEDVRTFAGQTVTFSFWAKANASKTLTTRAVQVFGSGGSGAVSTSGSNNSITTSWTRFTNTITIPSISGKTIGTGSYLNVDFYYDSNAIQDIDIWGFQVEAGSTATAFQTATGTIQGELAACQRYYYRINATASAPWSMMAYGSAGSTTIVYGNIPLKADMRVIPTSVDYSSLCVSADNLASAQIAISSATVSNYISPGQVTVNLVGSGFTQYRPYWVHSNNTSAGYLGVSAEL